MGDVHDDHGRKVGSVNAWSGIYDACGRKLGYMHIFTDKVYDESGRFMGTADIWGNVRGPSGSLLCKVAFFGSKVHTSDGTYLGSVGIAGAPEPAPDMQWRGAAALLLLCRKPEAMQPDLEDVAMDYLLSPTASSQAQLVAHGGTAMRPLLRALVKRLAAWGGRVWSERERQDIREDRWLKTVFHPLIRPARDLVSAMGEPAALELCQALADPDRRVRQAAALLLALAPQPGAPLIAKLRAVLERTGQQDATTVMLITFVLANGGDGRPQRVIESHAASSGLDLSTWLARTADTAVLELLGWERDVLF